MSYTTRLLLAFSVALTATVSLHAAPPDSTEALPLFASDDLLELTVEGDLRKITRDKSDDAPYRPATLSYTDADGAPVALEIGVKTRGNYRLHKLRCNVPPLRFDFGEAGAEGTVFEGQGRLKLVTHCRNKAEDFEQRTLREYLMYRIYNLFTDFSLRVRLVHLTYVDTGRKGETITRYAFLLEDDDDMALRNGGEIIGGISMHPEATDREMITQVSMFQFMTGNTDWGVKVQHNIELVYVNPQGPIVAVPYDFDWAALIDAPYAEPQEFLGIDSIHERRYQGFCRTDEEFEAVIARFSEKQEEVMAVVREFPYLEPKYAEWPVKYLEQFFEMIENPSRTIRTIKVTCMSE